MNRAIFKRCSLVRFIGVIGTLLFSVTTSRAEDLGSKEREAFEGAVKRYLEEGNEVKADLEDLFRREIRRRRKEIEERYGRESAVAAKEARERRDEAIEVLERFISRYPDDPKYTPEVMFRLAELYFEKAQDDYHFAQEDYSRLHDLWERGKIAEEPKEPEKDYSKSIAIYKELLARFPSYQANDAARYALGFCLDGMEKRREAVDVYRELIAKHPNSPWVPPAWLKIGEYYFDLGRYHEAIAAYEEAAKFKDTKYYEMALYKLAWSHFLAYEYPRAIELFKELIAHIDEGKGEKGLGVQLRPEAVEYLGISLADDDWNGDGVPDPDANVQRALSYLSGGRPFEREVLEKYADTLYAQHEAAKYPMAIEAYRALIAMDPTHPGNAAVKEKIIATYDTMRDSEKMIAERLDLVHSFGPGSKWYEANRSRPEVLARVDRQVELALEQAAKFYHRRAQELKAMAAATKDEKYQAASLQSYRKAADTYREYLAKFGKSQQAYEMTFYYADCLYYSFDFEQAVREYEKVRDWPGKTQYQEQAAFAVIEGLEKEALKRVREGRMKEEEVPGVFVEPKVPEPKEGEGKREVKPLPIPPLTQAWIGAIDKYLSLGLTRENDKGLPARLAYRAATEFYKYLHLEEARKRYEEIIARYPEHEVASYAAQNIINSFKLENDWESIQAWAKKIEQLNLGKPEERAKLAEEVRLFELGAQFKEAEALFDAQEYSKAAEAFIAVVDRDPKFKYADRALQNAAIAYQKARRYDSAAKVYERIVRDYPDSQYVEGALLQLAENSKKFYDFDRAVRSYQALRTRFPNSKYAPYALLTSSVLLEAEGRYEEAAKACEEYVKAYPSDENAPETLLRAAKIYERLGRPDEVVRVTQWFLRSYGSDPRQSEHVIESYARLADIFKAQGRMKDWEKAAQMVIKEFEARGLEPETPVAAYPARFQFELIEPKFKEYESLAFTGTLAEQGRKLKKKTEMLQSLEVEYSKVLPYKSFEWTVAAYYRMARLHEAFAEALFNADVPQMSEEEMEVYREQLEVAAQGYLQTAQERYATLIEKAKELKIANEWVQKAREAMNKYRPQEYPLFKEERKAFDTGPRSLPAFVEAL